MPLKVWIIVNIVDHLGDVSKAGAVVSKLSNVNYRSMDNLPVLLISRPIYPSQDETVYQRKEFISSSDMNFRPVNTATGPDGMLYIVDMHRGIIQQANWTKPGSFLRRKIDSIGLAQNVGHGGQPRSPATH